MTRTRMSLYYPVAYLIPSGIFMLVAPELALRLLLSNGAYGDVMPRLAGALMVGLGIIVLQIIRHSVEPLYMTAVWVRAFFLACWLGLYAYSRDPLFLVLLAVVGFGFVLTVMAKRMDAAG